MIAERKRRDILRDWRTTKRYEMLLASIVDDGKESEKRICELAESCCQLAFYRTLEDTNISILRKVKTGANIKALEDAGLSNMGQLCGMSASQLMTYRGIGESSASKIINAINIITDDIRKKTKINLSAKSNVPEEVLLLRELYYWRISNSKWKEAVELSRKNEIDLKRYLNSLAEVRNVIKWLLNNKESKQASLKKCDILFGGLAEYRKAIADIGEKIRINQEQKVETAVFNDFEHFSNDYYAVLAKVTKNRFPLAQENESVSENVEDDYSSIYWSSLPLNFTPAKYRGDTSMLTKGQKNALDAMVSGQNVFLTGGAGTGKSYVLKKFLELRNDGRLIVACAPTGIAALNLEWGVTIHKAFCVPVGEIADYRHLSSSLYGPKDYVKNADTIIIDEISMCPIDVFDFIMEQLHKIEVSRGRRFQIVVCGDFFQLPPVMTGKRADLLRKIYPHMDSGFCFESRNWSKLNYTSFNLTEVIRQKDSELISMLNLARIGDVSCLNYFNSRVIDDSYSSDRDVILSGRNSEVNKINDERLNSIKSASKTYEIEIDGDIPLTRINFVEKLTLKVGARVMALVNDNVNHEYVNGSIGTVSGLESDHVVVKWDNGSKSEVYVETIELKEPDYYNGRFSSIVKGSYSQIPLKLCYAITIHKSQGQSIDRCLIYPNSFEKGQLYVAMSRCTNPENLRFARPIKESDLRTSQAVIDFYKTIN